MILAALVSCLILNSCEKEEYGNLVFSSDSDLITLKWSETTDEIFYFAYDNYYSVTRPLYAADINSGSTRKIADITNYFDNQLFQKDSKIYYFNNLDMSLVKLYSIDISGTAPELIKDSLISPQFSDEYLAYTRFLYTDTTTRWYTILYNLDDRSETCLEYEKNNSAISISPDGEWLLLELMDDYGSHLSLYRIATGEFVQLMVSSLSDIYGFFWINDDPHTISWKYESCVFKNMRTGQILISSEDLGNQCYFAVSPTGKYVYYLEEEIPALASSIVGSHFYLNLINTDNMEKTVIDLERERIYLEGFAFSPEENRIAYIRDYDQIYIIDL